MNYGKRCLKKTTDQIGTILRRAYKTPTHKPHTTVCTLWNKRKMWFNKKIKKDTACHATSSEIQKLYKQKEVFHIKNKQTPRDLFQNSLDTRHRMDVSKILQNNW